MKGKGNVVREDGRLGLGNGACFFCISIRDYIHSVDMSEEIHTPL